MVLPVLQKHGRGRKQPECSRHPACRVECGVLSSVKGVGDKARQIRAGEKGITTNREK